MKPGDNAIMDWSKQAQEMMNAWAEAQQQMWKTWQDIAFATIKPADLSTRLFEQWRELAAHSLAGWTGGEPVVKQVAEQFIASQGALMRFLEMTTTAWATLAPQIEAGQDWQSALQAYIGQVRQQFSDAQAGADKAAQGISELWSLYVEEMQRLGQVWMEPLQRTPWPVGPVIPGQSADVVALTNLYWDAFERTFGSLLESPGLGYTRELNEKIAKGFDTWLDFRRASADYQAKLAGVWSQAFEQLMREMADLAEKGEMVDNVRELLLLRGQVADRVFIETFRTDEYIEMQGQLLNAAMTYRIQQREIMEIYLKFYDLPTRSEVDEAHRNIYELRKEVKALKKALAAMTTPTVTPARKSSQRSTSVRRKRTSAKTARKTDAEQEE